MANAAEKIMPPARMKALLATSKNEPVAAAIALTTEGDGIVLLHKLAKPKKVLGMLREEAQKAGLKLNNATARFGRAHVDTDYDSAMVRFFVNKEAPGTMRAKLVPVVKLASYQKVELNTDPALENEDEDGEGAPPPASDAAPPPPPDAPPPPPPPPSNAAPAVDDGAVRAELAKLIGRLAQLSTADADLLESLKKLATMANVNLKTGNLNAAATAVAELRDGLDRAAQPTTQPAAPDTGALTRELAGLISQVARIGDAARKAELGKLAQAANAAIKAGDAATAIAQIGALRQALDADARPAPASTGMVAFAKLQLQWRDAQATFDANLKALGAKLLADPGVQNDPRIDTIKEAVAALPGLVPKFGGDLEDALDAANNATDPVVRGRLMDEAVAALDAYRQQLTGAPLLAALEQFSAQQLGTKLALHGALDDALAAIKQQITR